MVIACLNIVEKIHDFEICLYDTQAATFGGLNEEFIHSARLDNIMMSFCSLTVLLFLNLGITSIFRFRSRGSNYQNGSSF
jgi:aspartyl aminopeptidase